MSLLDKIPFLNSRKYMFSLAVSDLSVNLAVLETCASDEKSLLTHNGYRWKLIVNDAVKVSENNYSAAVEQILEKHLDLPFRNAPIQVVLSSELVEQITIDRPELPSDEIAPSLQWSLRELVSIPGVDMLVDYYDPPVQATSTKQIHVVAASRSVVGPIVNQLHDLGLKIKSVIHSDMTYPAWVGPTQRVMLINQLPSERGQLHIISRGRTILTRRLRHSFDLLNIDADDVDIMENLALELQRSLDYYSGQLRQGGISEVLLMVANPKIEALMESVNRNLGSRTSMCNYPDWAFEKRQEKFSDVLAIGGLMWLMREEVAVDIEAAHDSERAVS